MIVLQLLKGNLYRNHPVSLGVGDMLIQQIEWMPETQLVTGPTSDRYKSLNFFQVRAGRKALTPILLKDMIVL